MKHAVMALMIALLIYAGPSRADAPAMDSHAQAATNLLSVMNVEKQMAVGTQTMTDLLIAQNAMLGPYRDVILKWAANFMTWDTFGPRVVALYKESFTERELRDLAAFYKTPLGQKSLTVMPELTRRMAELGASVAKEHAQELEPMIRARAAEIQKQVAHP
jgi:hypothetical protein